MATIEVRGYVKKPQAKTSAGGKGYCMYGLNVTQKDKAKDGTVTKSYAYFNVKDFKNGSPPKEGAFATIKGYFTVREFEHQGVKRQSLDINAQEVDVAEPLGDAAEPSAPRPSAAPADGKDPWE